MVSTSLLLLKSFCLGSVAVQDFHEFEDEQLSLLQTRATKDKEIPGLNGNVRSPASRQLFDTCATFAGASDIIGSAGNWKTISDYGLCKCWGDPHCSHLPFEEDPDGRTGAPWMFHYQYNGAGASRFAKAADGSWEIQTWSCGTNPALQSGVAVKVQGTLVEALGRGVSAQNTWTACYVNGELQPDDSEIHLPNGFHFKCPSSVTFSPFCASLDGQFLTSLNYWEWGNQLSHSLAVPWSVDVQKQNTICYDPSSKDNPLIAHGRQISETAVVPNDEVIFSQAAMERLNGNGACVQNDPPQTGNPIDPNGPKDPQTICDENHPGSWEHVQQTCEPLRENHAPFYEDCLIDECLRADDDEEGEIEKIAEAEEAIDGGDPRCNIEDLVLKTPEYSNLGSQGPDDDQPEGILYPDAGVINGQPVNVRLTAVGNYQNFKASRNGVKNGLGVVNLRAGTTADLQIKIESQTGEPISVDSLALSVFDLDEGKRAKGRTTVTACGSSMSAGQELDSGRVNDCPTATSTTRGTHANNPASANAISEDQKTRSASFAFGQGSSFPFKIDIARGYGGRNVLFALRPVVGCS